MHPGGGKSGWRQEGTWQRAQGLESQALLGHAMLSPARSDPVAYVLGAWLSCCCWCSASASWWPVSCTCTSLASRCVCAFVYSCPHESCPSASPGSLREPRGTREAGWRGRVCSPADWGQWGPHYPAGGLGWEGTPTVPWVPWPAAGLMSTLCRLPTIFTWVLFYISSVTLKRTLLFYP